MSAREIKDLCIAREALSRIPGSTCISQSRLLETLTEKMAQQLEREVNERLKNRPKQPVDLDDEIPF